MTISTPHRGSAAGRLVSLAAAGALALGGLVVAAPAQADPPPDFSIDPGEGPALMATQVTVTPPAGVTFVTVSLGAYHSVAIGSDGKTYAWGTNLNGQLGNGGDVGDVYTPVAVTLPVGVTFESVAAGGFHTLAIGSDGKTYAWGHDGNGQLGNGGANADAVTPVEVTLPLGVTFVSVAAGMYHSLAIGSDGKTYAWGADNNGQLGDGGTNTDKSTPVAVVMPPDVAFESISAGFYHSLALDKDGNAYAWGRDTEGQLGDGAPNADKSTPAEVVLPLGVTFESVSAGGSFSLAMGSDDKAYAWGDDQYGQLGDGGPNANQPAPVEVAVPLGVTFESVSAGIYHSLAIGSDSKAYAWGREINGQLGDGGPNANQPAPVEVLLPPSVTFEAVAAGPLHSLAIGSDEKIYGWGLNTEGQLGNGTNLNSHTPVPMASAVVVTSVTFGGQAGTGLVRDGANWKVTTPALAAGTVDVVLEWTLGGVAQTPLALIGGFTFTPCVLTPADGPVFTDVPNNHQFKTEIQWLADVGVSTGTSTPSGPQFRPSLSVSRDAMAAFLYRFACSPEFTPPVSSPFIDVPVSHTFYKEITWLASTGISTGWNTPSGAQFRPSTSVSRDAMAAFMYRFAGSPAFTPPVTSPFKDVPVSHTFYTQITWLASTGISTGWNVTGGKEFRPSISVSRDAMAAFLYRLNNHLND